MATDDATLATEELLSILEDEVELIVKPFYPDIQHMIKGVQRGKIVSRANKTLFNYQIGDKGNRCVLKSISNQRIILTNPDTEQVVLELYHNRFPVLCKVCRNKDVQCLVPQFSDIETIGSFRKRLAFAKIWYDIYNNNDDKHEHAVSLMLRKTPLRRKIQHRVLEFEVLDSDGRTNIGRIYPFSTDLVRSKYGHAVAMTIPQDMKVKIKATLLIVALILKSRLQ